MAAGVDEPGIMACYDPEAFLEAIRRADREADFVVASVHWGQEYDNDYSDMQEELAREMVEAGADAIIGTHTHCIQGVDFIGDVPVYYSLGNFWFDGYDIDTALAEVRVSGTIAADGQVEDGFDVKVIMHPGLQSGVYTAWEEGTSEGERILQDLEEISVNVTIGEDGVVSAA